MRQLTQDFFARDTVTVAGDLIGTLLVAGGCTARIVETEAYTTDAASHAVIRRHAAVVMRHTHGCIYVYKIYGMHYCLNFTADDSGPGAVLIRAAEPLRGLRKMAARRGGRPDRRHLLRGPGRLCQAMAIDLSHNALPLGGPIRVLAREGPAEVVRGPRIGITRATELPWRFYERDNPYVTRTPLRRGAPGSSSQPSGGLSDCTLIPGIP